MQGPAKDGALGAVYLEPHAAQAYYKGALRQLDNLGIWVRASRAAPFLTCPQGLDAWSRLPTLVCAAPCAAALVSALQQEQISTGSVDLSWVRKPKVRDWLPPPHSWPAVV